jgi:hypothetical protein
MTTRRLLAFLPVLALVALCGGCASVGDTSQDAGQLPAGQKIGEEIQPQEILTFAQVNSHPSDYFERTLLVEATVKAVCQKMGCWMQIEDQDATALVRWETGCGGKYAFPFDATGKRVVIQGSFYPKEISEADAQHLEEEAGGDLVVELEGYEFNASAVLVLDVPAPGTET